MNCITLVSEYKKVLYSFLGWGLELLWEVTRFLHTLVFSHNFVSYLSNMDKRTFWMEGRIFFNFYHGVTDRRLTLWFKCTGSLAIYKATILWRSNTLVPFSAHHLSASPSVKCLRLWKQFWEWVSEHEIWFTRITNKENIFYHRITASTLLWWDYLPQFTREGFVCNSLVFLVIIFVDVFILGIRFCFALYYLSFTMILSHSIFLVKFLMIHLLIVFIDCILWSSELYNRI